MVGTRLVVVALLGLGGLGINAAEGQSAWRTSGHLSPSTGTHPSSSFSHDPASQSPEPCSDFNFEHYELDPLGALGGSLEAGAPPTILGFGKNGTVLRYRIGAGVTGSGLAEPFVVGIPKGVGAGPVPVLVLFHGYQEDPESLLSKTEYFEKAMGRGWIVIAPMGAHRWNYGIEYAQTNTEAALEMLSSVIAPSFGTSVDLDRFYGVGFSMGGGWAPSFASRHIDANGGIHFAGLVVMTGTTSLQFSYWTNPTVMALFNLPEMFGTNPDDPLAQFDYRRVSNIDLKIGGSIDWTTDMVRNLSHVPTMSFYDENDPNGPIVYQTQRFHEQQLNRGGSGRLRHFPGPGHRWDSLPAERALNFLERLHYEVPPPLTAVSTLADRDGNWHQFKVTQAAPRSFTPFDWFIAPAFNTLMVTGISNMSELKLADPSTLGLNTVSGPTPQTLTYHVDTTNGIPFNLVLGGFASAPISIMRNKNNQPGWSWDAATGELTLQEPATAFGTWTITF